MMTSLAHTFITRLKEYPLKKFRVDISLIIALCIVSQHSFILKFAGIFLLGLLHLSDCRISNFRKIPLFYLVIPVLELFKFFFLDPDFSTGHVAQFSIGLFYWISSLFLCLVLYVRVRGQEANVTVRSLQLFSILNFSFSIAQYLRICMIEGVINPYNTGHHHPYGISSGDMITGLFHGVHLTNAFVSLFMVLFFLHRKNMKFLLISLVPLLLCGSNYASMVLLFSMGVYFVSSRQKMYALKTSALVTVIIVLFYWFVTPINAIYMCNKVLHLVSDKVIVSEEYQQEVDKKSYKTIHTYSGQEGVLVKLQWVQAQMIRHIDTNFRFDPHKIRKFMQKMDLSTLDFEHKRTSASFDASALFPLADNHVNEAEAIERIMQSEGLKKFDFDKQSGKKISYGQTIAFLKSHPKYLLFGSGVGGFSSNLAFNFSGVMSGSSLTHYFPEYQTRHFNDNHKAIYAYLKTKHVIYHSESNRPFSTYNQLLGEYGLIGFLSFLLFYLYYFFARISKRDFAVPVFIALLLAFNLNYFIESLNLLLFFELLMFISIKSKEQLNAGS